MRRRTFLASAASAASALTGPLPHASGSAVSSAAATTIDVALFQTHPLGDVFAEADGATRYQAIDRLARILRSALAASGLDIGVRAVHDDVTLRYDGDTAQFLADWQAARWSVDGLAADANLLLTADSAAAYDEGRAGAAYVDGRWGVVHFGRAFRLVGGRAPWLWRRRETQSVGGVAVHEVGHCLGLRHADGAVVPHADGAGVLGLPDGSWTAVTPMAGNYYPQPGVAGAEWPAPAGPIVRERHLGTPARRALATAARDRQAIDTSAGTDAVTCRCGGRAAPPSATDGIASTDPARDHDGDGRVEDVTGDGTSDARDARALLDALDAVPERYRRPVDFTGDGRVDIRDVAALLDDE
jgi:hypothetical protein